MVLGYGVNHIVPRSAGGTDEHQNLETLCKGHMTSADPRGVVRRAAERVTGTPEGGVKTLYTEGLRSGLRPSRTHTAPQESAKKA